MGDLRERIRSALVAMRVQRIKDIATGKTPRDDDARMSCEEDADAVLTAIAEAGPDDAMKEAGMRQAEKHGLGSLNAGDVTGIFIAMIRATQDHGKAGEGMGDG